ncbi:Hypothetical predicted protein [Scomber scombrus]|uniref:Uncharacterized protein n=1 Tax=Scomber scombrus TaxID=13677 RepID=A0AAV1QA90_SCOSC
MRLRKLAGRIHRDVNLLNVGGVCSERDDAVAACVGSRRPSSCSDPDRCGSLCDHPGDRPVDPILPQGSLLCNICRACVHVRRKTVRLLLVSNGTVPAPVSLLSVTPATVSASRSGSSRNRRRRRKKKKKKMTDVC